MAGRAEQDEAMPDRVLEAQPLPGMEDHAEVYSTPPASVRPSAIAGNASTTAS